MRAIEALMDRVSHENLTLVYVDRRGDVPEMENGEVGNGEVGSRELQLRICRLELERVHGCPVCGEE